MRLCSCFFSASIEGVSVWYLTNDVNISLYPSSNSSRTQNQGQLLIAVETTENGTLTCAVDINTCDLCNCNLPPVTVISMETSDSECIYSYWGIGVFQCTIIKLQHFSTAGTTVTSSDGIPVDIIVSVVACIVGTFSLYTVVLTIILCCYRRSQKQIKQLKKE